MPFAKFDYSHDYKNLNLRDHPELYRTGVGEQGVLLVEPYKSEILPHWKFKTTGLAKKSCDLLISHEMLKKIFRIISSDDKNFLFVFTRYESKIV